MPALTSFASVAAALAAPDALADALLELAELEQPAKATTIKAAAATAINFFFITVLLVPFALRVSPSEFPATTHAHDVYVAR